MKDVLNKKARSLHQGAIRAMFDRALGKEGVINLGIGEPDIPTHPDIIQAAYEALNKGLTHYTPNAGFLDFRRAIARSPGIAAAGYDSETEIIVTTGGMGALSNLFFVILEPGDEVLVPDPAWLNYQSQISFADGVPVCVPTEPEQKFAMLPETIKSKITTKTKAIVINNPSNPTGYILTENQLKEIASIAQENDLLVVSDEVYNTLVFDGKMAISIATLPAMKERTITVNSFSKSYAMTGWRVGYAAGPVSIIKKMTFLQENLISCVSSASQEAAKYALARTDIAADICNLYEEKRNLVFNEISSIPGISCLKPEGAFYIFPDIRNLPIDSVQFCERLLDEAGVVCIPGDAFGENGKGFIRISYSNSVSNLEESILRIRNFIETLK